MRIRATTRLRNDHMLVARQRLNLSQVDLAEAVGCPLVHIIALEKFDYTSPRTLIYAIDVAERLGLRIEEVAPEELVGKALMHTLMQVRDVSTENLLASVEARDGRMVSPSPLHLLEANEQRQLLQEAIRGLSFRERVVLDLSCGLTGGVEFSTEEIARIFRVTRKRIWAVRKQAIRKLQKPCVREILMDGE